MLDMSLDPMFFIVWVVVALSLWAMLTWAMRKT